MADNNSLTVRWAFHIQPYTLHFGAFLCPRSTRYIFKNVLNNHQRSHLYVLFGHCWCRAWRALSLQAQLCTAACNGDIAGVSALLRDPNVGQFVINHSDSDGRVRINPNFCSSAAARCARAGGARARSRRPT